MFESNIDIWLPDDSIIWIYRRELSFWNTADFTGCKSWLRPNVEVVKKNYAWLLCMKFGDPTSSECTSTTWTSLPILVTTSLASQTRPDIGLNCIIYCRCLQHESYLICLIHRFPSWCYWSMLVYCLFASFLFRHRITSRLLPQSFYSVHTVPTY